MRILGLDVGTTRVKAVELETSFGRFEVHEYHDIRVEDGENPLAVAERLLRSLPKAPDKISTSLRTSKVTFRNLTLPTKDKKAIQASVGFELEDELPFSLEDAVYDYSVLSQIGQQTQIHVAATLKRNIEAAIASYNSFEIDPDLITTEVWSYRTLLNKIISPQAQDLPTLLIQIGHEHTTFYVHWRGLPVMVRDIAWGGRDLTAVISKKYGITIEAAEKAKNDNGFVLSPSQVANATPEQVEFSQTVSSSIQDLIREIRQSNLTCKNSTHNGLASIYLSGGTSLLPGLGNFIAEEMQIPVQPLRALSSIAASGVTYSEHTDAAFSLALASSLCLVGSEKSVAINLRRGQYAKHGHATEFNFQSMKNPLIAASTIAVSLFLSLAIESQVYSKRLVEADAGLEKGIRSFFDQVSKSAVRTYMSNPTSLRTAVNKELNKYREVSRLVGPNPHSPLNYLEDLSKTIPKDVVVDMTHFQVGSAPTAPFSSDPSTERTGNLTFTVGSPQMVDRLTTLLTNKLSEMKHSETESLKVTFTGRTPESTYGDANGK